MWNDQRLIDNNVRNKTCDRVLDVYHMKRKTFAYIVQF